MDDRIPRCCVTCFAALLVSCQTSPGPIPEDPLVLKGEELFFGEIFAGNGRTCGSCHRAEDNFAISPAFIATLRAADGLFVAEVNPDLGRNFENPVLMRKFALILENQDGFDDLPNRFNMRGVPHTLALRTSIASRLGPQTGWSGDGAPGDGSLRSFAVGAVVQHFSKTLNRAAGVDFRLPTDEELNALEAFQLSLGRQQDPSLPLPLKGDVERRGQEIFLDRALGKCNACHFNAGANADPAIFGAGAGNLRFNTGVEALPDQPADLAGEKNPADDGFGNPGNGEFNTPPLVESADTGPFFHNNSVETIEGAVAFYNGDAFTRSPAGQLLIGATGSAINLDATQVVAVAAFLRVINALENLRAAAALLETASAYADGHARQRVLIDRAGFELQDAIEVIRGGGLNPAAIGELRAAHAAVQKARKRFGRKRQVEAAMAAIAAARSHLES
jgi:mono/diheme cytochrome c family protein